MHQHGDAAKIIAGGQSLVPMMAFRLLRPSWLIDVIEISRRHGDFAMVAAAAQIAVDDDGHCTRVTFGIGGAAPMPVAFPELAQHLVGQRLDNAKARATAQESAAALEPESDIHASAA